jgi:hypothetical protein
VDTIHGWVGYRRQRYRCRSCKKYYYPLDRQLEVSLQSQMSLKKERLVSLMSAQMPYRDVEKLYKELTGQRIGKMSAHRTVQRLGKKLSAPTRKPNSNKKAKTHQSADGTMIHIRKEGWKEAKVGACYQVDQEGKSQDIRYTATLGDRLELGKKLYALAGSPSLEATQGTAFISDGAEWLSEIQRYHFPRATPIVDFYHASEYVWKTARSFYGEGSLKATVWAEKKIKLLRKGKLKKLQCSLRHFRPENLDQKEILKATRRYFKNHGYKMDYPHYESLGYHIGSGVIEGACKNVIQSRMKRSGMRWSRPGAENLLKLRVTYLNHEWDQVALCQQN